MPRLTVCMSGACFIFHFWANVYDGLWYCNLDYRTECMSGACVVVCHVALCLGVPDCVGLLCIQCVDLIVMSCDIM